MMSVDVLNSVIVTEACALKMAMSAYEGELCGICHKEKADYFWVSPQSRTAHTSCVELIKEAEAPLKSIIANHFPSKTNHLHANLAHCFAIEKITKQLESETLLSYMNKKGLPALKLLFLNEGCAAVRDYYYAYCDN